MSSAQAHLPDRPCRHSRWRGALRLALLAPVAALLLGGCLTPFPVTPRPDTVHVPHPAEVPQDVPVAELRKRYAVSPDRNPDGLGVLDSVWLNSRLTLVLWEMERAREARNRIAYARSEAEQARVLAERRAFFADHVVFEGLLISRLPELVEPGWYMPEGVYLVDDRGRRFEPVAARQGDPLFRVETWIRRNAAGSYSLGQSAVVAGYPVLVFPGEAIGPDTRAVSLYLAAAERRMRFTWVFDPDYALPERQHPGLAPDPGADRLWGDS